MTTGGGAEQGEREGRAACEGPGDAVVRQMQSELEKKNHELGILWSLGRHAQRTLALEEVIQTALDGIRAALDPDLVLFYLKEDSSLVLRGHMPDEAGSLNEKKQVGTCLCGLAAERGEAVFSKDIDADARCSLTECNAAGVRSFAALPVAQEGDILGVIGLASRSFRDFSEQREFLETIVATIALSARNALLYERLKSHADELEGRIRKRTHELEEKNRELERFNKLFVDREFRIKELRDKVRELEGETRGRSERS